MLLENAKISSKITLFFNTICIHIAIVYEKMSIMNEEQAVFEQLTLSDFRMWSSKVLKAFNDYSITMTNIRIS